MHVQPSREPSYQVFSLNRHHLPCVSFGFTNMEGSSNEVQAHTWAFAEPSYQVFSLNRHLSFTFTNMYSSCKTAMNFGKFQNLKYWPTRVLHDG